ncbi:MAG TPA: hypothetical protein DDZ41_05615 [Flavobacterium sp.]|nr:hypothetical protein [Flavobacterium sp.]
MQFFKNIFDFYINSSLHVALAVFAFIQITSLQLNISYNFHVAAFGFFGTIAGYNFVKFDNLVRIKKIERSKSLNLIIFLSFSSFIIAAYHFLYLKIPTKCIAFFALLVIILYTLPVFPKKQNIRNFSTIKIFFVSFAWAVVTFIMPVVNSELEFMAPQFLKFLQRFLLTLILLLIFEIIDLKQDDKKLKTIPQLLGVESTKKVSYILILAFIILEFINPFSNQRQQIILLIIALLLLLFTFFVHSNRSRYYSRFWVEAIPIFWWFLLWIF